MSPDVDTTARAYQHAGDNRLEAWNIHGQQQQTERQHPKAEDREYGQETANDESASNREPELSKAPVQE